MLKKIIIISMAFFYASAHAGVTLSTSRVIYYGDAREKSIVITNNDKAIPYLIQASVNNTESNSGEVPFIVTPPLFKLAENTENTIRMVYIKKILPDDRESLFKLHVHAVPAVEQSSSSRMLISVENVIKLIYRPATLSAAGAANSYQQLTVLKTGKNIKLKNPTPYYINIGYLKINNTEIKNATVIPPFGEQQFPLANKQGNSVALKMINDFGGLTDIHNMTF